MSGLRVVDGAPQVTAGDVAAAMRRHRFRFSNEDQLQRGIAAAMTAAFSDSEVRREVTLADVGDLEAVYQGDGLMLAGRQKLGRVDLMVDRIAVEVKVAGSADAARRQLRRYAESREVDGLVLVTNQVTHGDGDGELNGKPLVVVSLIGTQL